MPQNEQPQLEQSQQQTMSEEQEAIKKILCILKKNEYKQIEYFRNYLKNDENKIFVPSDISQLMTDMRMRDDDKSQFRKVMYGFLNMQSPPCATYKRPKFSIHSLINAIDEVIQRKQSVTYNGDSLGVSGVGSANMEVVPVADTPATIVQLDQENQRICPVAIRYLLLNLSRHVRGL